MVENERNSHKPNSEFLQEITKNFIVSLSVRQNPIISNFSDVNITFQLWTHFSSVHASKLIS
jgi:hypothetical protein